MIRATALCALCLPAGTLFAQQTIRVPADQPTIQAGIDAAVAGDTVLVAAGTYREKIVFRGKNVLVTSEDGPTVTTIEGDGQGTVVLFVSGETRAAELRRFTVTNGRGPTVGGGGIDISAASPTIRDCIITRNLACSGGAGILIRSGGSPHIVGNIISDNRQSGCSGGTGGGGIGMVGSRSPVIENNLIERNVFGFGGGISMFSGGTPVLRGNIIRDNVGTISGGGIAMSNQNDALIVQNVVTRNRGSGIEYLTPLGFRGPFIIANTITENRGGPGIEADGFDKDARIENNIITAPAGETALFCGDFNDPNPPVIRHNSVWAPTGTAYGGICSDLTGIDGNISGDPRLVPGTTYQIDRGSPCIDAGDSTLADLPTKDRLGDDRIVDGDRDGTPAVDIGADEFTGLRRFGESCAGPGGRTARLVVSGGVPHVGNASFAFALENAAPGVCGGLIVGESDQTWIGNSLPLNLAYAGAPDCSLAVSLDLCLPAMTSASGTAAFSAAVPNDPTFAGVVLYFQWIVVSPSGFGSGAVTEAVEAEVLQR